MLILTRRKDEVIRINDDITISVLAIRGNQVRLGIEAPKNVSVHREEIYKRIAEEAQDEKQASSDEAGALDLNQYRFLTNGFRDK